MGTAIAVARSGALATTASADFLTLTIAGQRFGLPVASVQDVLGPQKITRIPLAPREIAGALNLRGRIVTAVDIRRRLGLAPAEAGGMSVVVEHHGEPYSLMIDSVSEVLSLPAQAFEANPPTLNPRWRDVSAGIYRLDEGLLVVLEIDRLLDFSRAAA